MLLWWNRQTQGTLIKIYKRRCFMMLKVINVYECKDGRLRAYCRDEHNKPKIKSYPRILMEESLGRPLKPYEDVHHIDEDVSNNDISNFDIINHGEHQKLHAERKYFDKIAICDVCGKPFLWTAKRQSGYYRDIKRGNNRIVSCSKSCSSYYGRQEQLRRNSKAECGLNGESSPNGNTVPNKN